MSGPAPAACRLLFIKLQKMKRRIILYEDNAQLRESIEGLIALSDDFEVVGSFENAHDAVRHAHLLKPDIIFMDIDMGESVGIDAVRSLRQNSFTIPVVMLTVFDDSESIFNALYAGANGYLLKKHTADRLIPAAYEALQGGGPMSPAVAALVLRSFHEKPSTRPDYGLTPREKQILSSMASGNSYKMIAHDLGISIDTVRVHVKHIYEKLHVNSQTEAVSKAFREKLL